jgi:transposase InsO family protein
VYLVAFLAAQDDGACRAGAATGGRVRFSRGVSAVSGARACRARRATRAAESALGRIAQGSVADDVGAAGARHVTDGYQGSKRTIQKHMKGVLSRRDGQGWATFLANHADATWACDFIQAHDILFRQVYAFFIVHLASRKVVYTAACRNRTQEWTAQQLRNATMDADAPKILLRDRDDKYGPSFDSVAKGAGTHVVRTAVRALNMNAVAERFVGSARREMLDHVIVLDDEHLGRLVRQYQE